MISEKCPHCGVKLGNYLHVNECPICHAQLQIKTSPIPPQNVLLKKETRGRSGNKLAVVCRTVVEIVKQACSLPRVIAKTVRHKWQQTFQDDEESEAPERKRHPTKPVGE